MLLKCHSQYFLTALSNSGGISDDYIFNNCDSLSLFCQINCKICLFIVCFVIFLVKILDYVDISMTRFERFVANICKKMVFNTDINVNPSLTLPQDGSLPLGISYWFICVFYVISSDIIILLLIVKMKSNNFDLLNNNKTWSNSSWRSSDAKTEIISRKELKWEIIL